MVAQPGTRARALRTLAVFHSGDDSGPARTLEPRLRELAGHGPVVALFPWAGGAATRYGSFAEVEVGRYRPLIRPHGIREIAGVAWSSTGDVAWLASAMRRLRPGLVIGVTTVVPATLAAARLRRLPCLLYAAELRSPAGDVVTRVEERMATTVVACSTTAARQFHAARVVYPGIDDSEGPSREAARDALALPRDAWVVATAGNLSHGRGQDVLIRAIADLDGDVLGLIAGAPHPRRRDLDYRAQLLELVDRLGLAGRVHLLGHVPDVEKVFAAADVVVNPTRRGDAFGRAAIEAIVARRPVVVSSCGAAVEVVGDLGLLVPPDDSTELASALRHLRLAAPSAAELDERRRRALSRFAEPEQTAAFVATALETAGLRTRSAQARPGVPSRSPGSG